MWKPFNCQREFAKIQFNKYVNLLNYSLCHLSQSGDLLQLAFVVICRPLCMNIIVSTFLKFLKTTRPIRTFFGVKHLYGKRNLKCDIHGFTTPGAS